jgi:primosomal protein N'
MVYVGTGTQKIEENIEHIFQNNTVLRVDSDSKKSTKNIAKEYEKSDIIIGTPGSISYIPLDT